MIQQSVLDAGSGLALLVGMLRCMLMMMMLFLVSSLAFQITNFMQIFIFFFAGNNNNYYYCCCDT